VFWAWAEEDDAAFAAAEVRGWRQWPLNQAQTVPAASGRLSALSVSHSKSVLYGVFVQARRALNGPKRPGQFGSLFSSGGCTDDRCGGDSHPCKTGQPSAAELGTTDEWDDVIRVDNCVRTDVRSGWTSGGEGFRLMVRPRPFHQPPRATTMRLEFSEPHSRKRLAFSTQAL
jgi:hypothetical protein